MIEDLVLPPRRANGYGNHSCDPSSCRGVVTGDDGSRLELRSRYGEHWVPALLSRIRSAF